MLCFCRLVAKDTFPIDGGHSISFAQKVQNVPKVQILPLAVVSGIVHLGNSPWLTVVFLLNEELQNNGFQHNVNVSCIAVIGGAVLLFVKSHSATDRK